MAQAGSWIRFATTVDAFQAARGLSPDLPHKALYHTNKRSASKVATGVSRAVRAKWNIKTADVPRPQVDVRGSRMADLVSLRYKGKRLSFSKFNPVQRGVQRGNRLIKTRRRIGRGEKAGAGRATGIYESLRQRSMRGETGMYAKIFKDKSARLIQAQKRFGSKTDNGPKAFIARGRGGYNSATKTSGPPSNAAALVFARRDKKRLPIDRLTVAAVPQMMRRPSVTAKIDTLVENTYDAELKHQLEYQFNAEFRRIMAKSTLAGKKG